MCEYGTAIVEGGGKTVCPDSTDTGYYFQKGIDYFRVEMLAGLFANMIKSIFLGPGFPVRPVTGERIVNVHYSKNTRRYGDLRTPQSTRVACAIPFFMVTIGDVERSVQVAN